MASFLTEEQRQTLEAAIREKQAQADKAPKPRRVIPTRKGGGGSGGSGAGLVVGVGGKYTHNAPLRAAQDMARAKAALDAHDPNYDSEEEAAVTHSKGKEGGANDTTTNRHHHSVDEIIALFKKDVTDIVQEYFHSGDMEEVALSLEELGLPRLMHHFVKRAITLSMDKHAREREMVSVLLSSLYADVVSPEHMQRGFASCVEALHDTRIDIPDAMHQLSTFITRAIVDDILPPAFLAKCRDVVATLPDPSAAIECLRLCEVTLAGRHAAERFQRCWGAGAGLVLDETRDAMRKLLDEYLVSKDDKEADVRLRELAVPFFHHELVKMALLKAIENPKLKENVIHLLSAMVETGLVTISQLSKGLQRVVDARADTALDYPTAPETIASLVQVAREKKWIDEAFSGAATTTLLSPASIMMSLGAGENESGNGSGSASAAPGRALTVPQFKQRVSDLIREYFGANDVNEVVRSLTELNEPGFHHLFVKRLVSLALDRSDLEREMAAVLLSELFGKKLLSRDQVALGFLMLLDATEQFVLDVPNAVNLLSLFLGRAIVDEILAPSFLHTVVDRLSDNALGLEVVQATSILLGMSHAAQLLLNGFIKVDDDIAETVAM